MYFFLSNWNFISLHSLPCAANRQYSPLDKLFMILHLNVNFSDAWECAWKQKLYAHKYFGAYTNVLYWVVFSLDVK